MTEQESAVLLRRRDGGVTEVVLNRPDKRNAFDDVIIQQLIHALTDVNADTGTRVVILRSEGKHFSAGADLAWMRRMAGNSRQENLDDARQLARLMAVLNGLSKPVIGLVQGAAYGGAVGLAACCDIVLATEQSSFCLSEVKLGLIPAVISPYVVRAIGERQARRYFLSAEVFSAWQARDYGLVHVVCEDMAALEQRCDELLQQLAKNGPDAMKAAKDLVFAVSHSPIDDHVIEDTAQRIADIRVSEEGQEGLSAFLNKRKANWVPEE
ncbi:enoyl-CoA hydratase/isomerase family protein [Marinobacter lutaoensis]|jgi:methylglutaconyl-CoA hydratase|uniref:Gamma-carboxygeranoyl-CoA hydratase n=1 Tax=Marinobacter lutaoensis TaxID=135739 RepID=A0A1V2DSK4_9GAMM|nr:enoyl-CoA hydratase/isomerase family protein [Marinobacter lutaoensis]MBI42249.1 gamma-carboxygeranoyl-CoA hydratase [Oceanospirillales bacterium]NVD36395.1 enoyl-CoA hydratase/isomerase family protein [Marinobacter lutaoensis]ONF43678.1 gamma-carboxygeranoyl-CoA hydratase [Marinobacter lutaoensis]|tara:strand:- start:6767 stop:7570 length:804 start_codon:yes stop_codon:yes gene_type:complete